MVPQCNFGSSIVFTITEVQCKFFDALMMFITLVLNILFLVTTESCCYVYLQWNTKYKHHFRWLGNASTMSSSDELRAILLKSILA